MKIKIATLSNFEGEILESSKPSVVKFANDGCHLCVNLKPICERLAEDFKDKYKFYDVNTFEEEKLTEIFSDDGVPTIYVFHNGDATEIPYPDSPDEKSGYSEQYLREYLESF